MLSYFTKCEIHNDLEMSLCKIVFHTAGIFVLCRTSYCYLFYLFTYLLIFSKYRTQHVNGTFISLILSQPSWTELDNGPCPVLFGWNEVKWDEMRWMMWRTLLYLMFVVVFCQTGRSRRTITWSTLPPCSAFIEHAQ